MLIPPLREFTLIMSSIRDSLFIKNNLVCQALSFSRWTSMFAAEIQSAGSAHVQEYGLKPSKSLYKATLLRIAEDVFSARCHIMHIFLNIHLHFFCFSDSHCLLMLSSARGELSLSYRIQCCFHWCYYGSIPSTRSLQRTLLFRK